MDPVWIAVVGIISLTIAIPVIIKVGRNHTCRSWGEVKNGWQYCTVCGKGQQPIKQPCLHPKWKVKEESPIIRVSRVEDFMGAKEDKKKPIVLGNHFIMECERCGELKHHVFKIN